MSRLPSVSLPSTLGTVLERSRLPLGSLILAVLVFGLANRVFGTYGVLGLVFFTGLMVLMVGLAIISLRSVEAAILVWLVTVLGFRTVLLVPTPGLPDLSPDRVMLMWALSAFSVKFISEGRRFERPHTPDIVLILHTLYLLASCLWANPQAINLWTRSYLMPTAGYFFGKYLLREERWFMRMLYLLVAVNIYHSFTAVVEHFRITALIWPRNIIELEGEYVGRSVGIFGNPGVLGVFIGMILPLQFYMHVSSNRPFVKVMHLVGIGLAAMGLFYTYTRGPWLATAVGLVVLGLLGLRVYMQRILIYSGFVVLIAFAGVIGIRSDEFLKERMETEHTIIGRLNAMGTAFRMFLDKPIFGVGFRQYGEMKQDYRETMNVPFFGLVKSQHDKHGALHDIYIGILAEEGFVGSAMQGWLYFLFLRALLRGIHYRRRRADYFSSYLLPPIGALMACYFVGGFAFDYRYFTTLNSVFYLFGGVLIGWAAWRESGHLPVFSHKLLR